MTLPTTTPRACHEKLPDLTPGEILPTERFKHGQSFFRENLHRMSADFPRLPLSVLERALKVKSRRPISNDESATSVYRRRNRTTECSDREVVPSEGLMSSTRIHISPSQVSGQKLDKTTIDLEMEMTRSPRNPNFSYGLHPDHRSDEMISVARNAVKNCFHEESSEEDVSAAKKHLQFHAQEWTVIGLENLLDDFVGRDTRKGSQRITVSDKNIFARFPAAATTESYDGNQAGSPRAEPSNLRRFQKKPNSFMSSKARAHGNIRRKSCRAFSID
ncbi:hypothetical protein R1flu_025998 [Riccia fluitans]|uniref:Uncharacterized protein n=1 Tax=Riccia fluitans TaxID=41844 RepID=A0ABD1XEQ9_9MARC